MPPSAIKTDPRYDDRMVRVLKAIDGGAGLDIRELLVQIESTDPDHAVWPSGHRRSPEERESLLTVDNSLALPTPEQIGIVDDVLTNGSHFVAAKRILQRRFPGVPVVGIFFARRELVE
jgi:predicted amidophosphoribosyltransferase